MVLMGSVQPEHLITYVSRSSRQERVCLVQYLSVSGRQSLSHTLVKMEELATLHFENRAFHLTSDLHPVLRLVAEFCPLVSIRSLIADGSSIRPFPVPCPRLSRFKCCLLSFLIHFVDKSHFLSKVSQDVIHPSWSGKKHPS